MHISRKDKIEKPIVNLSGEQVFEMIGNPTELGGAINHSFAHIVIPSGCSSQLHYHPVAEETYYILKGTGKMIANDREFLVKPGDAIFIAPPEKHQIFANGSEDLEFAAICAPAWEPTNSVFLD